ncbi:MAG: hypothetical protein AAF085_09015, partial [Planctomycetota bacterium]
MRLKNPLFLTALLLACCSLIALSYRTPAVEASQARDTFCLDDEFEDEDEFDDEDEDEDEEDWEEEEEWEEEWGMTSNTPGLRTWPDTAKSRVPFEFSAPRSAKAAPPL